MTNNPRMTLEEARAELEQKLLHGPAMCPCCKRKARVQPLSITSSQARWLAGLVHDFLAGEPWPHFLDIELRHNIKRADYPKLRFWGLIEAKPSKKGEKSKGRWRPTALGIQFARGIAAIAHRVETYYGQVLKVDDSIRVTIKDVAGIEFDLAAYLARLPTAAPDLTK